MEPSASQAAINAIAALQKKVQMLEEEAIVLADQKTRLDQELRMRDSGYQRRELALNEATARAEQMFKNATVSVKENEEMLAENRRLKTEIESVGTSIQSSNSTERSLKSNARRVKSQTSKLMDQIDEYTTLLSEFLSPPPHACFLTSDELAVILSKNGDRDLVLPAFAPILSDLQEMPTDVSNPDMKRRREIACALSRAISAVTDADGTFRRMELQRFDTSAPKRYDTEMRRLSATMALLSNQISEFRFL
jgi:hypothetical protein